MARSKNNVVTRAHVRRLFEGEWKGKTDINLDALSDLFFEFGMTVSSGLMKWPILETRKAAKDSEE